MKNRVSSSGNKRAERGAGLNVHSKLRKIALAFSVAFLILAPNIRLGADGAASHSAQALDFTFGSRDKLTAADLLTGTLTGIVRNDYFIPVGKALPAAHSLSGLISFRETALNSTRPDSDWSGSGQSYFPEFTLPVVLRGGELLPLERGIIYSGNKKRSFWNVIVSPGRVWKEAGDGDYSRASFPFVFTDNYVGQALNGLATFLFKADGISFVAVQITQETSPAVDYTRGDAYGVIAASYEPRTFPDSAAAVQAREAELAARPVVKDWSELRAAGLTRSFFSGGLAFESVSSAALLLDGILYLQPAGTRSGPYPYPLEMRHGVYSVTKTLVMGLSIFALAARYGGDIFSALITDYVPALAAQSGWRGVTFEHAFDMATGTQGNDENLDFIRARSVADKLAVVRAMPDAPYAPGEYFNYASSNTFTLSCALNAYVKAREGPNADFWDIVCDTVLRPLGIEFMPVVRTIEPDGSRGTPVAGWGSYPTVIESARVGELFSREGLFNGRQLLDGARVREALERTARTGYITYSASLRYLHSIWHEDVYLSTGLVKSPHMNGRGGNYVLILPGPIVGVCFADEGAQSVPYMVAVAEFYRLINPSPKR
jgi:hypothetical protein